MIIQKEITHFHLFCGLGGGAKGFNKGQARVGNLVAKFNCLGGIDSCPAAIRDFERAARVQGTVTDLFSRAQYIAFHGKEPPPEWREAMPEDIQRAAGWRRPNILFSSPPCKGYSGLLSEKRSKTQKYQALNELALRGIWLALEAWKGDPPEFFLLENVPRIANRGRHFINQILALLNSYDFEAVETTHDCGELGELAQSRKRFLLVARHRKKVPPFLYEPEKRTLRAVGDILGRMPLPGDMRGGPMHRVPTLQWKTWVRLAFVEAGKDWRSLSRLNVTDGKLADYLIVPEYRDDYLGINAWESSTRTISGRGSPSNGVYSVADPRFEQSAKWTDGQAFGVRRWDEATGTVTSKNVPGQGPYSVADPRPGFGASTHHNVYRLVQWEQHSRTVTGSNHPSGGAACVADPRPDWKRHSNNLSVMEWDNPSKTVIAGGKGVQGGWMSVADPRPGLDRGHGDHYLTGGHYGVIPWDSHSLSVSGSACHDNGWNSVADPRIDALPTQNEKLVCIIRALDNTWHRPFTTLELAALQSLVDPEEQLELDGLSDSAWRERIGNAVPPAAAAAIAGVMGTTLLLAWSGETFVLSSTPIWVRPIAVALSVKQPEMPL